VTDKTLELIDIGVYTHVKPADKCIPNLMRFLSAKRFGKTAREWCKIFAFRNSGTYSSHWMILDYNIFKKIKGTNKTPKYMVYMMEQTPKKIVFHKISNHIQKVIFSIALNKNKSYINLNSNCNYKNLKTWPFKYHFNPIA